MRGNGIGIVRRWGVVLFRTGVQVGRENRLRGIGSKGGR